MKKLRFGVVGCGNRSGIMDYLLDIPEVEIAALTDVNVKAMRDTAERLRETFGISAICYESYEAMLEQSGIDAVLIMSPDFCHEFQAIEAMKRNIAVYLEKPLAISTASCDNILGVAKKCQAKIMIGHNMRYMWFTNKMKEIIDAGYIGEVKAIWVRHFVSYGDGYFRKWYAERQNVNGLLLQKGAHDLDIIHFLAGAYATRVSAFGNLSMYDKLPRREPGTPPPKFKDRSRNWPHQKMGQFNPVIDIEDQSIMMMQLANGVQASYMQCHYTPDTCRNYTVIGSHGRLENYGDFGADARIEVWTERTDTFKINGDMTFRQPRLEESGHGGADPKIIRGFVDYVRGLSSPLVRPQDARYAVACGDAATYSLRNGNVPMEIKPLPDDLEHYNF